MLTSGCAGSDGEKKKDRFRLDLAAAWDGPQRAARRRDKPVEALGDAATARVQGRFCACARAMDSWWSLISLPRALLHEMAKMLQKRSGCKAATHTPTPQNASFQYCITSKVSFATPGQNCIRAPAVCLASRSQVLTCSVREGCGVGLGGLVFFLR